MIQRMTFQITITMIIPPIYKWIWTNRPNRGCSTYFPCWFTEKRTLLLLLARTKTVSFFFIIYYFCFTCLEIKTGRGIFCAYATSFWVFYRLLLPVLLDIYSYETSAPTFSVKKKSILDSRALDITNIRRHWFQRHFLTLLILWRFYIFIDLEDCWTMAAWLKDCSVGQNLEKENKNGNVRAFRMTAGCHPLLGRWLTIRGSHLILTCC